VPLSLFRVSISHLLPPMPYNDSAVAEPASTFQFPGSATFPTEIWPISSARRKAGWDGGRRRRPEPATDLLSEVGSHGFKLQAASLFQRLQLSPPSIQSHLSLGPRMTLLPA